MSGRGNCRDNAEAGSLFSMFKTELIEGGLFASLEEARREIFSYTEDAKSTRRSQAIGGGISANGGTDGIVRLSTGASFALGSPKPLEQLLPADVDVEQIPSANCN
jgi:transposase InsO family protein